MKTTDWEQALRLAASLGLTPAAFWQLSLREWRALTARQPAPPMRRAELSTLITNHHARSRDDRQAG